MTEDETEILKEMLNWIRFTGLQEARDVIDEVLTFEDDERKQKDSRIAYELTDGEHSQREIANYISYSHVAVGNWQSKWSNLGIANKNGDGRYVHLTSLEDAGLEGPEIPNPEEIEESADEN